MLQEGCKLVAYSVGLLYSGLNFSIHSFIFGEDAPQVLELCSLLELLSVNAYI